MTRMGNRSPTVLITGATGALGGAAIRAFNAAGWTIRTLSRRAPLPGTEAAGLQHFAGEIDNSEVLRRAMAGADAVLHMAALLHLMDPPPSMEQEYRRVNVDGTAALMQVAADSGVRRVVFSSSIAVYGPSAVPVDEDTPPAPDTFYARTKLEAERRVLAARDSSGRPFGCVLRVAAVYGPSIKGNYERLVRAIARARFVPIGPGRNVRSLVFEDDVANAMVLAATHAEVGGRIFNVTDGHIHTVAEIVSAIADALGRRPPRFELPVGVARSGARVAELLFGLAGMRAPVTVGTIDKYVESVCVSGDRIQRTLGFAPQWTLADGWQHTARRMAEEGRL